MPSRRTHVDSDEMNFSMSVFTSLGSGHVDNFAWSALDNDVSVLPKIHTLLLIFFAEQ